MDRDIRRWAEAHLIACGQEACPARINAIHDAVVMVLQTGCFGDERSDTVFAQAYAAYGNAFAAASRQRGLDRHPHRRTGANDN